MDLHAYFPSASTFKSQETSYYSSCSSSSSSSSSEENITQPSPRERYCSTKSQSKSQPVSSVRHYNKKWEEQFPWLEFDQDI